MSSQCVPASVVVASSVAGPAAGLQRPGRGSFRDHTALAVQPQAAQRTVSSGVSPLRSQGGILRLSDVMDAQRTAALGSALDNPRNSTSLIIGGRGSLRGSALSPPSRWGDSPPRRRLTDSSLVSPTFDALTTASAGVATASVGRSRTGSVAGGHSVASERGSWPPSPCPQPARVDDGNDSLGHSFDVDAVEVVPKPSSLLSSLTRLLTSCWRKHEVARRSNAAAEVRACCLR